MALDDTAVATQRRILAAAAECIARDGLAQVRMATIAKAAGVSTALLHYHFATKERLFAEVLTYSYDASSVLDQDALSSAGKTPAERLAAYLDRCLPIDEALIHDWLLWQELALLCLRDPDLAGIGVDLYERMYQTVAQIINDGITAGEFADCDAHDVAVTALALTDGLGTRVLAHDPQVDLDGARRIVATTVGELIGFAGPLPMPGVRRPRRSHTAVKRSSVRRGVGESA